MAMDICVCLCSRMYARTDLFVQITQDVSWGIHGVLTKKPSSMMAGRFDVQSMAFIFQATEAEPHCWNTAFTSNTPLAVCQHLNRLVG